MKRNEKKRRECHLKGTCNTSFYAYDSDQKRTPPNFSATSEKKETQTRKRKAQGSVRWSQHALYVFVRGQNGIHMFLLSESVEK